MKIYNDFIVRIYVTDGKLNNAHIHGLADSEIHKEVTLLDLLRNQQLFDSVALYIQHIYYTLRY
jgi:hypothetical protein